MVLDGGRGHAESVRSFDGHEVAHDIDQRVVMDRVHDGILNLAGECRNNERRLIVIAGDLAAHGDLAVESEGFHCSTCAAQTAGALEGAVEIRLNTRVALAGIIIDHGGVMPDDQRLKVIETMAEMGADCCIESLGDFIGVGGRVERLKEAYALV